MKKSVVGIVVSLTLLLTSLSHAYTIVSQGLDTSSYTASSFWTDQYGNRWTPDLAFDGNWNNMWNSGYKPGEIRKTWTSGGWLYADPMYTWIEVDLGSQREISRMVLGVEQLPPGYTEHVILSSLSYMGNDLAAASSAALLRGNTCDGQRLLVDFTTPVTARYIQVRSLYSPSWIAWNEIQIMIDDVELPAYPAATPAPEPGTGFLMAAGAVCLGMASMKKRKSRR